MTVTVTAQIQLRKGTAAAWTSANPTLASGEVGYETDTGKQKIGDGTTAWTSLAYYYDPAVSGGVTDHGALTGLSDDDHLAYHTDARGDARYAPIAKGVTNGDSHDHSGGDGAQIAYSGLSGLPTLGTAAATASSDYAVAAKGVTNGDSHDHSGGDGAQIAYSSLSSLPTLGTAAATASTDYATSSHNHSGTYEPADATLLKQADVDDAPVNGVTTAPVSSNWAYDHAALATAHGISTFGASLVDDADVGTARSTLGLGTAATTAATDYATASHAHGNLTNAGAIGSTENLPVITTTSGALTVGAFGTGATNFCAGNDARLSDARTPSAHSHEGSAILSTGETGGAKFLREDGDGTCSWQTPATVASTSTPAFTAFV